MCRQAGMALIAQSLVQQDVWNTLAENSLSVGMMRPSEVFSGLREGGARAARPGSAKRRAREARSSSGAASERRGRAAPQRRVRGRALISLRTIRTMWCLLLPLSLAPRTLWRIARQPCRLEAQCAAQHVSIPRGPAPLTWHSLRHEVQRGLACSEAMASFGQSSQLIRNGVACIARPHCRRAVVFACGAHA